MGTGRGHASRPRRRKKRTPASRPEAIQEGISVPRWAQPAGLPALLISGWFVLGISAILGGGEIRGITRMLITIPLIPLVKDVGDLPAAPAVRRPVRRRTGRSAVAAAAEFRRSAASQAPAVSRA